RLSRLPDARAALGQDHSRQQQSRRDRPRPICRQWDNSGSGQEARTTVARLRDVGTLREASEQTRRQGQGRSAARWRAGTAGQRPGHAAGPGQAQSQVYSQRQWERPDGGTIRQAGWQKITLLDVEASKDAKASQMETGDNFSVAGGHSALGSFV